MNALEDEAGQRIDADVLDTSVAGMNLAPGTLRSQLSDEPTLFVFLRHFGCVFCLETIADMRGASEADRDFPRVLFFHQGSSMEGRVFLRRHWPAARAVADPDGYFYAAFAVERGGLARNLGPQVWRARRRAVGKGHRNGRPAGDVWRMPGVMLTRGDSVRWVHEVRHAGDHPDLAEIGRINHALLLESASV